MPYNPPRTREVGAQAPGFVVVSTPDPHRVRRRVILEAHPEVRGLFGHDRRTAGAIALIVTAQVLMASALAFSEASWLLVLVVAALVGAPANHACSMAIHECAHNLVARSPNANRLWSLLANLPLVVPSAITFRRSHLRHHGHFGDPSIDADIPSRFEIAFTGRSRVRKALWLATAPLFMAACRPLVRGWDDPWQVANLLAQAAFVVLLALIGGPVAVAYLLVCTVIGHGLHPVAGHWIHEHYVTRPGQETYSYYGPLNALTFNVGHHVEHHDFMRIPGWRLPALRRLAPEHYDEHRGSRSWAGAMWSFVMDRERGLEARIVRPRAS